MINIKPRKPRAVLSSNDPNFEINQYGVFDDTRLMVDDLGTFVDQVNQFGSDLALDLQATSASANTIGTGNKTFIVQTNLGFAVGMILNVASSANVANRMRGAVVSYSKTTGQLVLSVEFIKGSGTFSDWVLSLALDGGAGESNLLYALTTGTGTAYEASFASPIAEYNDNQTFKIKFHADNETNATLKLSGVTPPLDIKIQDSTGKYVNVFKNDIVANHVTLGLIVNGGTAILITPASEYIRDRSNKIIGGDFTTNPWQRGTSFSAAVSGTYTADRWAYSKVGTAVHTITKSPDSPSVAQSGIFTRHSFSMTVTTAQTAITSGDLNVVQQNLEGLNVSSFGFGQTGVRNVTLSFWVKGAKTGIHCVAFRNGASNRSYVAEYTISVTNAWEFKTITLPVDITGSWLYDNNIGLILTFAQAAGTTFQTTPNAWQAGNFLTTANQVNQLDAINNFFHIALVQLQAGSIATEFQPRSVGHELVLCQRYYEIGQNTFIGNAHSANATVGQSIKYQTTKRVAPTLVITDILENANLNALTYSQSTTGYRVFGNAVAIGNCFYTSTFNASAEL